jgi:hypothetical protein
MKTILSLLMCMIIAGCATSRVEPADPVVDELLDKVVVKRVDLDLGASQKERQGLLWDRFVNKPYQEQFSKLSAKDWYSSSQRFQARLLSEAQAAGLDDDSLRKILAGLRLKPGDQVARIPVGAFAARKGSEDVWIIVLKWEFADAADIAGEKQWLQLGHIEVIAFRMKDHKKIDSVRCD